MARYTDTVETPARAGMSSLVYHVVLRAAAESGDFASRSRPSRSRRPGESTSTRST
jgi:hypothetical protein